MRLALIALVSFAALTGSAAASTGVITRADTTPAYTRGSFAGSVSWDECGARPCKWLPVATVQPALPSYSCRGDETLDNDPNTRQVWSGGQRTVNEAAVFDLADQPILTGVVGQRLCVSAIVTVNEIDQVCVRQYPLLGLDPATCPYVDRIVYRPLTSRLLTVVTPSPVVSPPAAQTQHPSTVKTAPAKRGAAARLSLDKSKDAASKALARKFGRSWTRGKRKKLTCRQSSATRGRCAASWRYRGKRHGANAGVRLTRAGNTLASVVR